MDTGRDTSLSSLSFFPSSFLSKTLTSDDLQLLHLRQIIFVIMSPIPARCTLSSENMIAAQRQMMAHKIMQTKAAWTASRRSKAPSPHSPRYPMRDISDETRDQPQASRLSSRRMIMKTSPQNRPCSTTALNPKSKSPMSAQHYKNFRGENDESDHSISTATMTIFSQEQVLPPLHLPTFKPAVGCILETDFLVRCFITRLRAGVTVMKHCRSRFRRTSHSIVLLLEDNGETLTWKPVDEDPSSDDPSQERSSPTQDVAKACPRAKRLSLFTCREVRLATTPDAENPHYTGSAVLREKCNVGDAHKSFALVFGHRTLDITSTTEDQCKMLTEGFSALCYRLHVRMAEQRQARDQGMEQYRSRGCFRV